jgi:hypothetical protein
MVDENELIILVLGGASLLIFIINAKSIKLIPSWRFFIMAFLFLVFGSFLTIIEALVFPEFLNFVEHLFYLLCTFFLLIWIFRITEGDKFHDKHSNN